MGINVPGIGNLTPIGVIAVVEGFDAFFNKTKQVIDGMLAMGVAAENAAAGLDAGLAPVALLGLGLVGLGAVSVAAAGALIGLGVGLYEFNKAVTETAARTEEMTSSTTCWGSAPDTLAQRLIN